MHIPANVTDDVRTWFCCGHFCQRYGRCPWPGLLRAFPPTLRTALGPGFVAYISAMCRGGMYAARSGVLGGTRTRAGHTPPHTTTVGRGRTPPCSRTVRGPWVGHPIPRHCRAGVHARRGTFVIARNVPGRRERPRAACMPPLRPSVLWKTKPQTGFSRNARPAGSRPRPTGQCIFSSMPSRERSFPGRPVAAGVNARPTNRWQTFHKIINVSAVRRGGMYAARTGVLFGTRIRDGHTPSHTTTVGRGLDPAVVPGNVGSMGRPPHPAAM